MKKRKSEEAVMTDPEMKIRQKMKAVERRGGGEKRKERRATKSFNMTKCVKCGESDQDQKKCNV